MVLPFLHWGWENEGYARERSGLADHAALSRVFDDLIRAASWSRFRRLPSNLLGWRRSPCSSRPSLVLGRCCSNRSGSLSDSDLPADGNCPRAAPSLRPTRRRCRSRSARRRSRMTRRRRSESTAADNSRPCTHEPWSKTRAHPWDQGGGQCSSCFRRARSADRRSCGSLPRAAREHRPKSTVFATRCRLHHRCSTHNRRRWPRAIPKFPRRLPEASTLASTRRGNGSASRFRARCRGWRPRWRPASPATGMQRCRLPDYREPTKARSA